ncbi:MAG: NAD(P)H-dependent oxidoreductase [Lachnospiraceae bacterium]|nr:NAD(P)H-dependent oxidoreductase [Lachnospiraceae bacterium]
MKKVLYINCTIREDSRTNRLAEAVLAHFNGDEITEVKLRENNYHPLTEEEMKMRTAASESGIFDNAYFDAAKAFAESDIIVIGAPYYDLSFPSNLKIYIENITINNLTFSFQSDGSFKGLCKAEKLYYITTAGGEIGKLNFGYDYIKALALYMYGIKDCQCIRAVGLDLMENDPEFIVQNALEGIKKMDI